MPDNQAMNAPAAAPVPGTGPRGRLLVVDDDRLVLFTVVAGLREAGWDVIEADNGDDAILLAREHRPQMALLDIRMAGKSGFDVAATLRDPKYGIPFMFLSAFADAETQRQVQALGALDYLVKPLDVAQIVPRVEAAYARVLRGETGGFGAAPAAVPVPVAAVPAAAPAAAAPAPVAAVAPAVATALVAVPADAPAWLGEALPLAVGVLMHRHGLTRAGAWAQLQRLAAAQGLAPEAQAARLLDAVEELARSGAGAAPH
jgi:response regulator NasT